MTRDQITQVIHGGKGRMPGFPTIRLAEGRRARRSDTLILRTGKESDAASTGNKEDELPSGQNRSFRRATFPS